MPYSAREKFHKFVNNPTHNTLEDKEGTTRIKIDKCDDVANIKITVSDNGIVENAQYIGHGCSIFISTLEATFDYMIGKNVEVIKEDLNNFIKYIDKESDSTIEELEFFEVIREHVSRKKCNVAPIKTILEIL